MTTILRKGEKVRHNVKKDWGVGKIISIDKGGTIRVVFEGNNDLSIAKGMKFLTRAS